MGGWMEGLMDGWMIDGRMVDGWMVKLTLSGN